MCVSCRKSSATPTSTRCRATRRSWTAASRMPTAATRNSWTARNRRKLDPRSGQLVAQVALELSYAAVERRRQAAGDDLLQRRRQKLFELCHRLVGAREVETFVEDCAHLSIDQAHDCGHVGLDPVF